MDPIRRLIRESVSLKGWHLVDSGEQMFYNSTGEKSHFTFLQLDEARYLFFCMNRFVLMMIVSAAMRNKLTLPLVKSHFICIVPIIQAKHPPYPTLYRGQTETNKDIKSSNNKRIHVMSPLPPRSCDIQPTSQLDIAAAFALFILCIHTPGQHKLWGFFGTSL